MIQAAASKARLRNVSPADPCSLIPAPLPGVHVTELDTSELPVLVDRLDSPVKLFAQCLGEKSFNWDIELFSEDYCKARIDVILP